MSVGLKYEPVLPMDKMILDFLPKEGSTFADIYPIGETVKAIGVKVFDNKLKSSMISARIRLMHTEGLVHPVKSVGGHNAGKAWQITPAGERRLSEWKEAEGGRDDGH